MMARRLLSYNLLMAIVLFVVGYAVGVWIGDRVVSFATSRTPARTTWRSSSDTPAR